MTEIYGSPKVTRERIKSEIRVARKVPTKDTDRQRSYSSWSTATMLAPTKLDSLTKISYCSEKISEFLFFIII